MADAKKLRIDAARKALAERGGQSVYPRSTADLQDGLQPTLSLARDSSKASKRLTGEYRETRDLEDFQDLLNDAYDGKFDKYRKEISDRKYAGLDSSKGEMLDPRMEEDDLELSRLVDRGSFGDVRPEMAEIAKQDADFIRQTQKSVRDLTDLANDSETEDKKRQLRDRVKNQVLGR